MKKTAIFFALILSTALAFAEPVEFRDALKNNLITAELDGNGESPHFIDPLQARITNVSSQDLQLHIKPGYIFQSMDSTVQDLIITEDVIITLNSGESVDRALKSMCIEQHNSAPVKGIGYRFSHLAEGALLKLAQYINDKKYFNSMAQNAVWCLTDGNSILNIYGEKEIAQDLREYTCKLLNIPVPDWDAVDYESPNRYSIEINGTMTFQLMKPTHIIIGLFNEDGIMVRELYNINKLDKGMYRKEYSFDATVYTDALYYIMLIEDGKITLRSTVDLTRFREEMEDR